MLYVRALDVLGYREPLALFSGVLSMFRVLFRCCCCSYRLCCCPGTWNPSCRYTTSWRRRWRATVAHPLIPHYYAFAGHPNPLQSSFSLLHGELVYKCYGFIPCFGSFTACFHLYAQPSFVTDSAPQCSGSAACVVSVFRSRMFF